MRATTLITWGTAVTDANGNYSFRDAYIRNPFYSIDFENSQGFEIWGNAGVLTGVSSYYIGYMNKKGVDWNIYKNSYIWDIATVSNSAYEYYDNCKKHSDTYPDSPPTDNLRIWVVDLLSSGSAPMLKHVKGDIGYDIGQSILMLELIPNAIMSLLANQCKRCMPDVTIGTRSSYFNSNIYKDDDYPRKYSDSDIIYHLVCHELSHASHFSKVGSEFWCDYVNYIITSSINSGFKKPYGDRSNFNSGVCEVGEMWGFAMGYIEDYEKYGGNLMERYFPRRYSWDYWFYPHRIWDLYTSNTLSRREIFNCMDKSVGNMEELKTSLINRYPQKAHLITEIFRRYDN